jgi:Lysophospholipase L1 and related esterases
MKKIFIVLFLFFLFGCSKQEIVNYPAKEGPIVAFGDSLTYGNGVEAKDAYPALLEDMWHREVINLGISGDTSLQGAARKDEIAKYHPSFVLIEFSANDFFKKIPREQTKAALEDIVDYVQNIGAVAVLIDTGGNSLMESYKKMIKQIAKEKRAIYIDGIMDDIFNNRNLKSDSVHPNEEGYKIIAQKIDKALKNYL